MSHGDFTTAPVTLAAGTRTIAFRGLNSLGGDHTALVAPTVLLDADAINTLGSSADATRREDRADPGSGRAAPGRGACRLEAGCPASL